MQKGTTAGSRGVCFLGGNQAAKQDPSPVAGLTFPTRRVWVCGNLTAFWQPTKKPTDRVQLWEPYMGFPFTINKLQNEGPVDLSLAQRPQMCRVFLGGGGFLGAGVG